MDMDLLLETDISWLAQLGEEDPMFEQDYVRQFLVDTPNAEEIVAANSMEVDCFFKPNQSLSSSAKCNSAAAALAVNNAHDSTATQHQQKMPDSYRWSPNSGAIKIITFGSNNSSSSRSGNTSYDHNDLTFKNGEPIQISQTHNDTGSASEPKTVDKDNRRKKTGRRKEHYDHLIAERQRRQHLTQCLIALSALAPGLKKMDKASILVEAIKHMKELKKRLNKFEESGNSRQSEADSSMLVKRSQVIIPENQTKSISSSSPNQQSHAHTTGCSNEQLLKIEAQFLEKQHVIIKVFCKKQKGVLMKIIGHIENLHLSVITTNAVPFQDTSFNVTIVAKVESEFDMKPQNVVKSLHSLFQ